MDILFYELMTTRTDRMQMFSKMLEAYLELSQAFKVVLYAEKVNGIKLLTFFDKKLHLKV